jgi:RNA polymerase sigma-70 factor (ECF subfamily)
MSDLAPRISKEPAGIAVLVDRILGGERDLFLHLVQEHERMLRSFLASQLYNLTEVDDLAQETFVAAFRDLASFRSENDFGSWLRGIARNRLLTHFRSVQRRDAAARRFQDEVSRIVAEDLEKVMRHRTDTEEKMGRLLGCVSRLPEKLRRIVHAGLDGLKAGVLATELGTTVPAVYQLHYRANRLLRACLEKEAL